MGTKDRSGEGIRTEALSEFMEYNIDAGCKFVMETQKQLTPMVFLLTRDYGIHVLGTEIPAKDEEKVAYGQFLQALCSVVNPFAAIMISEVWMLSGARDAVQDLQNQIDAAGGIRNISSRKEALIAFSCFDDVPGPTVIVEIIRNASGAVVGFGEKSHASFGMDASRLLMPWKGVKIDYRLQELARAMLKQEEKEKETVQ